MSCSAWSPEKCCWIEPLNGVVDALRPHTSAQTAVGPELRTLKPPARNSRSVPLNGERGSSHATRRPVRSVIRRAASQ
ncbi:hypothetical protein [Saccharothrix sp. HUAS TT1]|uniref:hypothetical protein n=1 Tax=unclassified Saccharothrix TaxID=2593673 RepID=UPI00345C257D